MRQGDGAEAGFTLIEALVALVLGAMVVAAVLSTVRVAARVAERAAQATGDAEAFARAGAVLEGDGAHALWLPDARGRPTFLGLSRAIDLPELPRPGKALPRGPVLVQYRLESDPAGTRLMRSEVPQGGVPAPGVLVWQAEGALEFRFLDQGGDWLSEWTAPGRLPRAFALMKPGAEQPMLVAELPALLPLSCSFGPGPDCPLDAGEFP